MWSPVLRDGNAWPWVPLPRRRTEPSNDQRRQRRLRHVAAVIGARDASQCRQKGFTADVFIERLALCAFAVARPRQNHGQGLIVKQRQACPEPARELVCQYEVRVL